MRLHMCLECADLPESPLTNLTLMWFLAGVNQFMVLKLLCTLKSFPTDLTHIRQLTRVSLHVIL